MPASLSYNPDRSLFEAETPEGETFGPIATEDDGFSILIDDDGPIYLAAYGFDGLKPDTLYELVEVPTTVEEGVEMAVESEDIEDDEGDDDDAETAPITS